MKFFGFSRLFNRRLDPPTIEPARALYFYNTLTGQKESFTLPPRVKTVRMYNCGPTVYDTSHIGNLRSYVFADLVRRTLEYNNFTVNQVINITDFGHLSSDADAGPDKMTKALKREGVALSLDNMKTLAQRYTAEFLRDLNELNIDTKRVNFPNASDHVPGEIAMVRALEEKGYTYNGNEGVYFDTSSFPSYGKLGNIDLTGIKEGARIGVSDEKRNPSDFLLWKKDRKLGWESPWGLGFPGWHIECSAMIRATLGEQIDIHTGGVDLMPTHHNNEIAQSESATGKTPFSRFWMHHAFLNLNAEKISKSLGNVINLPVLIQKGIHPLSYRYFLLGAHYRTPMNFTLEALGASQNALARLIAIRLSFTDAPGHIAEEYRGKFHERINDDLDTSGALAVVWDMIKDDSLSTSTRLATLLDADRVLGLNLAIPDSAALALGKAEVRDYLTDVDMTGQITDIIARRETARADKNWTTADALREELDVLGLGVEDASTGPRLYRKNTNMEHH